MFRLDLHEKGSELLSKFFGGCRDSDGRDGGRGGKLCEE